MTPAAERGAAVFAVALGVVGLGTLAVTVAGRIGFFWPLEWMEGATLHHALRLTEGAAIYAPPSASFVPYLYPPLGYAPIAAVVATFGPSLPIARLPSVLALAGTLALVGRVCVRRGGGRAAGLAGAGLFAAGYGYTGAFLDLARIDSVFILLVVAGAERLDAGRSRTALACLAASVFAKQHGVWLLLAASLWLCLRERRQLRDVAVAWAATVFGIVCLEVATGGWFLRYVFEVPAAHPIDATFLLSFPFVDVLLYLPLLVVGTGLALRDREGRIGPIPALLVAGLVAGALGRAHPGGHDNVRLAPFALLVLAGAPPLLRGLHHAARRRTRVLSACALALQLAILWQPPRAHWPRPDSAAAFVVLERALARCASGGPAVVLDHALFAGVPAVHTMALSDLRMAGGELAGHGSDTLVAWLASASAPRAVAVGERFPALDRVLVDRYDECLRVPSPRLATGYTPGRDDRGRRWQVVYTAAAVGPDSGVRYHSRP